MQLVGLISKKQKNNSARAAHFVQVDIRFTPETLECLKCKISPLLTWVGWTYVQTIFSEPKFLGCSSPCSSRARELRYNHQNKWQCLTNLVLLSEKSTVSDHRSNVPVRKQPQGLFCPCVAGTKAGRGGEGRGGEGVKTWDLRPATHAQARAPNLQHLLLLTITKLARDDGTAAVVALSYRQIKLLMAFV